MSALSYNLPELTPSLRQGPPTIQGGPRIRITTLSPLTQTLYMSVSKLNCPHVQVCMMR